MVDRSGGESESVHGKLLCSLGETLGHYADGRCCSGENSRAVGCSPLWRCGFWQSRGHGVHERLGQAVGLRAVDRSGERSEVDLAGERAALPAGLAADIIVQLFNVEPITVPDRSGLRQ